jgi:hypothetical protein
MGKGSALALLCVFALVSCGRPTSYDGEGAIAELAKGKDASYVKCKDAWKVGKTLPADYRFGCLNGSSVLIEAYTPCSDGKTRLFVHKDQFGRDTHVAISGSKVHAYSKAAQRAAMAKCRP